MIDIDYYRPILEFFSVYLGSDTEILLCDTEKILLVENPLDETHYAGAPITEMQQALLQNPECENIPYNVNYRTLSRSGEKMRSATMFIRNGDILEGLLTINKNVGEMVRIRQYMETIISGDQSYNVLRSSKKSKPKQSYESLTLSMTETINNVLEEATIRFNAPPSRLTAHEKLSVIKEMDSRGVFLTKGSINEVAEKLGSSKATIYRYLHQLDK
jgi:predicted transcriptional regulator YheO